MTLAIVCGLVFAGVVARQVVAEHQARVRWDRDRERFEDLIGRYER